MEVTVKIKTVYGRETIYPACDITRTICQVAKRKTLSQFDINLLKHIGWTVNVEQGAAQL